MNMTITNKPMKHEVKVGSRFKLGSWEWRVTRNTSNPIGRRFFEAVVDKPEEEGLPMIGGWHVGGPVMKHVTFEEKDADSLDWIKLEVTFTKEQVVAIEKVHVESKLAVAPWLWDWLDAHTEKE